MAERFTLELDTSDAQVMRRGLEMLHEEVMGLGDDTAPGSEAERIHTQQAAHVQGLIDRLEAGMEGVDTTHSFVLERVQELQADAARGILPEDET